MTRYAIHPLEQNFQTWEAERKAKRISYWMKLKKAHKDYEENECHGYYEPNLSGFRYWMERKWGISIEVIDGNFGQEYSVVNEQKFLLFEIKYS